MEVVYERCAGLDVHKKTVVACRRRVEGKEPRHEVRKFSTTTKGLLELSDWLGEWECTHVAMESTGVYWKPVWHILEGSFELVLANAARIRNVPGRKSDVSDARWIADLLAHGLIQASFVPPGPIQDLRELTRTRKQLVREIAQHTQRIQRVLEDSNIKLSSVISDVLGVSGRRMLRAIIDGQSDPEVLAALRTQQMRAEREDLVEALRGKITEHHRFMLRQHLGVVESLERTVREFEAEIERVMEPFRAEVKLVMTIPGISKTAAHAIVSELGVDMKQFPTERQLVSWAGLCPGLDESAGKQRSTRLRKGAPWLKTMLVQCAWAATRAKGTYLQAQYLRLKARRGPKKALVAVAASMLTGIWHILKRKVPWKELGPEHFTQVGREAMARSLLRRIERLGYKVEIRQTG